MLEKSKMLFHQIIFLSIEKKFTFFPLMKTNPVLYSYVENKVFLIM